MIYFNADCRQRLVANKMRGCIPLFSGDLLLTTGYFHVYLLHQTLKFSDHKDISAVLREYPGVSEATKAELLAMASRVNAITRDRTDMTWRIIANHRAFCKMIVEEDRETGKQPRVLVTTGSFQSSCCHTTQNNSSPQHRAVLTFQHTSLQTDSELTGARS